MRIIILSREDGYSHSGVEIPPMFPDGQPEIPAGYNKPIPACIAILTPIFVKRITIKLADEGLTVKLFNKLIIF
jgi:hypothetical protein